MGKAILFLRVSTLSQDLESQEMMARKMAAKDGYKEEDTLVIKYKESAVKLEEKDRAGLQDLYAILESRNDIDAVYVTELSRLSRKEGVLLKIRDTLKANGIQLVCENPSFRLLDEKKELSQMAGLVFSIFGFFAAQEVVEKKERFARGKALKVKENKYIGGFVPFGYKIDKELDNLIVIKPEDAKFIQEVYDFYEGGLSIYQITRHFRERGRPRLSSGTISKILTNEKYTGKPCRNPASSYEWRYPPIISQDQFDRCRSIAKTNNTLINKARGVYYGSKIVICKECGRYCSVTGSKSDYRCIDAYYTHRDLVNFKTHRCENKTCLSINIIDSLLWHIAQEAELTFIIECTEQQKQEYQKKISDIQKKIDGLLPRFEDIESKHGRVTELYISGDISREKKNEKLAELERNKHKLRQEKITWEGTKRHLEDLLRNLDNKFDMADSNIIADELERIISIKGKIASITDDAERSEIVHRHIKKLTFENRVVTYNNVFGKRQAKARFIKVEFHSEQIKYYLYLPYVNTGGTILESDAEGNMLAKIGVQYLGRFTKRKTKPRTVAIKKAKARSDKYPPEKYAIAYSGLAEFLHVSLSIAYRWTMTTGVLQSAMVENEFGECIFEKTKCIELLQGKAEEKGRLATAAKKILNKINEANGNQ